MLLSIVTLNYKKPDLTLACIASLHEQFAQEFEKGLIDYTETNAKTFYKDVLETKMWTDAGEAELKKAIGEFKSGFKA